jgi:hypothetical protein
MAGRSLTDYATRTGRSAHAGSTGLFSRLASHARGRRSGDQFCVYVADRLVLPQLTANDITAIGTAELSLDALVASLIHNRLKYRFVETTDGALARELERMIRQGALPAGPPTLNAEN